MVISYRSWLWLSILSLLVLSPGCFLNPPLSLPTKELEVAWQPLDTALPLLPTPKKMKDSELLRLKEPVWIASEQPELADDLVEELKVWWEVEGVRVSGKELDFSLWYSGPQIVLTLGANLPPEGYSLEVNSERVVVKGADVAGLSHGVTTLKQLLSWDDGLVVRGVVIEDWPSLAWRGVHLHTGAGAGPTQRKLIERVLSPMKLNKLVIEAQYAKWESHPELWVPELAIPLSELKLTAESARTHGLEPIPLIQTLSHVQWMFVYNRNSELKAGGLDYLFDPTRQESWDIVFDLYAEAVEVFQARTLHIGHDEVRSLRSIFPGTEQHVTQVVEESVLRCYSWLQERDIKTMMWHDTMVHRSESAQVGLAPFPEDGAKLRKALPKDILVADWQYGPGSFNLEFPEVSLLVEAGFPTVGAVWDDPELTRAFAAQLVEQGGSGLLQTTWPGRVLSDPGVEGFEHHQFAGIVDAAQAAWTGGSDAEIPAESFRRLWDRQPRSETQPRKGFALDLSGLGESRIPDLPAELIGAEFAFAPAIGVRRDHLELAVPERPLEGLAFLWYTESAPKNPREVAQLEVEYRTGETEKVSIRYGKEVSSRDSTRPVYIGPLAWTSKDGKTHLWRWFWKNPRPDLTVESFTLKQSDHSPGLTVFAITGVEFP